MGVDWTNGVRIIWREEKRIVEMLVKIKKLKLSCQLKEKELKMCIEEKVSTKQKNLVMEHVKMIGVLVGVCLPCFSLEQCHDKVDEVVEINKLKNRNKKRNDASTKLFRSRFCSLWSRT